MEKNTKKSKNILFLISSIGGGGAERVACRLVSEFSKNHNVYLMYFMPKEKTYKISPNVTVIQFFTSNKNEIDLGSKEQNLIRIKEVEKTRIKYKIDITISFLYSPNIINVNASGHCIKILSERNDPEGKGENYFKEMALCYEKADKIVFQSNYIKEKYSINIKNKSVIIPNPVCVSCLAEKSENKKIVAVGRLVPQKNHKFLIKAFSLFHKIHTEYHLNIYGIGPLLDELQNLVKKLNLVEYIHFKGFFEEIHEQIKDAEQFILSSDFEGMPNALLEAMMMGLPCISTNCSGVPEFIEDGKNGILVDKNDIPGLAGAMIRLSEDKNLRETIANNAMKKADEWKLEKIIKKWEDLFDLNS